MFTGDWTHARGRRGHGGFDPWHALRAMTRGPWGQGFPFGGPPFRKGFGKMRRGDVRDAILLLLAEEPRNGYQIMQEIEQRSEGAWRPSPGSVYPALQQLEDEGLVRAEEEEGRKRFVLTDAGRASVEDRDENLPPPWETASGGISDEALELGRLAQELGFAFMQVLRAGSPAQIEQAREVLINTRRELYRILAEGDPEMDPADQDEA